MKTYHILNGDALLERFPAEINGQPLVCRECLIDGPVQGRSLAKFYENRMQFLGENYGDEDFEFYLGAVIPEFEDMQNVEPGSTVYFWFEADLFCQVNFWFCASLMDASSGTQFRLVIPEGEHRYGFSNLKNEELLKTLKEAVKLPSMVMALLQQLWKSFKSGDQKTTLSLAGMLELSIPQLSGLRATLESFYQEGHLELLKKIIASQSEPTFGAVFREFCLQAPEYGFGDLQVLRLYRELL